ncbi:MAG: hypothetical protein K2X66_06710, partial [Cyanobacteria bacterium]|nr:hypothetical protein [Cyanobacteriota bacterium]
MSTVLMRGFNLKGFAFQKALHYPFLRGNLWDVWVFPASLLLMVQVMNLCLVNVLAQVLSLKHPQNLRLLYDFFVIFNAIWVTGFFWHVSARIQASEIQASENVSQDEWVENHGTEKSQRIQGQAVPDFNSWFDRLRAYFRWGVKLYPYYLLLAGLSVLVQILVVDPVIGSLPEAVGIGVIAILILLAFPWAALPVVRSAPLKTWGALFNLSAHLQHLGGNARVYTFYGAIAVLLCGVVFGIYIGLFYVIEVTEVSFFLSPFLLIPMLVSMAHLLTQSWIHVYN